MAVRTELTPSEAAKIDGRWYFAERKLILDWNETRSMTAPASPA